MSTAFTYNDIIINPTTVIQNISQPLTVHSGDTTEIYLCFTATSLCTMAISGSPDAYSGYCELHIEKLTNSQNVDGLYAFHFTMQKYIYEPGEASYINFSFTYTAETCNYPVIMQQEINFRLHGCQRYYMYYTTTDGNTVTPKYNSQGSTILIGNTTQFGVTYLGTEQSPTISEPNRCVYIFDDRPTKIGDYSFYSTSIKTIDIYDTDAQSIGNYSFSRSSIESAKIPESTETIGNAAFSSCAHLTSVTINDYTNTLGASAFSQDVRLERVVIGEDVKEIKNGTFMGCTALTGISIPNYVTNIGISAFTNCRNMTSLSIGSRVASIGADSFRGCTSLTTVSIPNSVTGIGNSAFYSCGSLTAVTIGDSATTIGSSAFSGCRNILALVIGSSVSSIGDSGFSGCQSMMAIYSKPSQPPTIQSSTFYNVPSNATLYVSSSAAVSAYERWAQFTDIRVYSGG